MKHVSKNNVSPITYTSHQVNIFRY